MSKLAIKGHPTRGKEVIELLEMLGGKNDRMAFGNNAETNYFIDKENKIDYDSTLEEDNNYTIFTIKQFEEKFHYKVGDKVRYNTKNGNIGDIISMAWDEKTKSVIYTVAFSCGYKELTFNDIIPYKCNNAYEHNMPFAILAKH